MSRNAVGWSTPSSTSRTRPGLLDHEHAVRSPAGAPAYVGVREAAERARGRRGAAGAATAGQDQRTATAARRRRQPLHAPRG